MTSNEREIRADYRNRLNRVFEFIDENLDSNLSLKEVAKVAFFSPYHFHRIFKQLTGETLNEFITRRRIERSVSDILHRNVSISEIAHAYGFSDNSAYTKAFKKYYGISPSEFKRQNPNKFTKIRELKSKIGQNYPSLDAYVRIIDNLKTWIDMNSNIEIRQIPEQNYVYITCIGPNELPGAFQKLLAWAIPNGLLANGAKLMTVYQDSLKITEEAKARFRACLQVGHQPECEFESATIPSGTYIVGKFEIPLEEFEKAWTGLYVWMDNNGYARRAGDSFEVYHNNFNDHPDKKAIVDLYIPIQ